MGPEATMLLQQKLIDATPARDDSDHIPLLIDMNPQVPSRIAHLLEGTGEDPGPTLAAMAARLESAGACALAMPCNTAHHFARAITDAVRIPLLNMVELAADHAANTLATGGRVGMLASPAVQKTQLFDRALEARGLSAEWPVDDTAMLAAIRTIKQYGEHPDASATVLAASKELASRGADFQLVACSEFSIVAHSVAPSVSTTDTLDILTRAIIDVSRGDGSDASQSVR